jgi:hypothetical protein
MAASPAARSEEPPAQGWGSKPTGLRVVPGIALMVVGGALIGTGAAFKLQANSKYQELMSMCGPFTAGCDDAVFADYRSRDNASMPLVITGGVVAAAGLAWTIVEIIRKPPAAPPPADKPTNGSSPAADSEHALAIAPVFGPGYGGASLHLRF